MKSKIIDHFKEIFLKEEILGNILGQEETKLQIKSALLMEHNIILIGPPGIGKTTLAKNVASLIKFDENKDVKKITSKSKSDESDPVFVRVQGSPDLTVEDLIGDIDPIKALKFGPMSMEAFTPGKIFKADDGVLFFDELNRCPQKLLNSLLQILEEGYATIGSYEVDIPANIIFIGTMNPEDESTEKLSDVFLDRFDIIYMSYPETLEIEKKIVSLRQKDIGVTFPDKLFSFSISFVRSLRESEKLEKHPSVRASISLCQRAMSNAFLDNRKTVEFTDITKAVVSVLSHRIQLKPSVKYLKSPTDFIKEQFKELSKEVGESEEGDVP